MKKHQLVAMVLSALSAGLLISCSKPNEDGQKSANEQQVANTTSTPQSNTDTQSDSADNAAAIDAIDISSETAHRYITDVAKTQILPAYQQISEHSRTLNSLATQYCQANNSGLKGDKLNELRAQWLTLAKAWAQAEIINFGPAMDNMSNLYIHYYPDERGLVHQGVIDLIDANPNLTADQLAAESAIVQGIPGLEEVLYANESLTPAQCNYIVSASGALTKRLANIENAWNSSADELVGISQTDSKVGVSRWINSVLALIETTKSSSLDQPLGITGNKKGHLPAQAAGQSREIITAKVAALNKALTDPALMAILSEAGQDTLAHQMSSTLAEISTLLAQMPEDLEDATPDSQKQLYDKFTELTRLVKRQLMPTLGVQVGFNSTDGD